MISNILGLFPRTQATVSNSATVDFTPIGWAFITWGVIYLWQGLKRLT